MQRTKGKRKSTNESVKGKKMITGMDRLSRLVVGAETQYCTSAHVPTIELKFLRTYE